MMTDYPTIRDLWDFSDIPKSETTFREWLAKTSENIPYHLELKTQLARTFSLRNQFDKVHAILDTVEPHIAVAPIVEVRYLLERGRSYNSAQQPETAIPLFERAWNIGRDAKLDGLAVDAAHMLAIALSDTTAQIAWHQKSLDLIESSEQEDAKRWAGSVYNNLGWTYHDEGEYEKALDIFQKALKWREQRGNASSIRIAKYTVARTLRSLERYEAALEMQQALRIEFEAAGEDDGFVYEEIGECLLALNRPDDAKSYFAKAYALLKDISWVEQTRLERIKLLAE